MNTTSVSTLPLRETEAIALDHVRAGRVEPLRFPGIHGAESTCDMVTVYERDRCVVVFAQTKSHIGTSVTNFFAQLAARIYNERLVQAGIHPGNVSWFEHYSRDTALYGSESFERVLLQHFEHNGKVSFHSPDWQRVNLPVKQ